MASERRTHQPNPEQLKDFEVQLRNHKANPLELPSLKRKRQEVQSILAEIPQIPVPEDINPLLLPSAADQGLVLTPYDEYEGMEVVIPDREARTNWEMQREYNLRLANHPVRLEAMRQLENAGFTPPPSITGILDRALRDGQPLQLSDLAQNTEFARMLEDTQLPADGQERQVFIDRATQKKQVHRTTLLASGPFSFVGKRVRNTVGMGAMPDIVGSTLMCETALQMGSIVHLPEVGQFSDPDKQATLAQSVLQHVLSPDNPLFDGRSEEDVAFMKELWRSSLVGVLEVDPDKALRRAEKLAREGVQAFRIYGHTQGGDVVKTTQILRNAYPDAEIFASQITSVDTALACEYAGADAIVTGVGSGGRCSTADRSQLIPSNAHLPWSLRGKLSIPVIGEGGAIDEPVIALLVGMSGMYGSGSLGGGTFEAPGGMYFLKDQDGTIVKPYGGEASDRFKYLSGRTYGGTGLPYFSEGKQTFKPLRQNRESMTQNMIDKWEDIILGAVVMGIEDGPCTIEAMQAIDPLPLYKKSATTQYLQKPH